MVSAGEKEVWRAVMEDDGAILLRNFDLVERNLRRNRCGMIEGIDGHGKDTLEELKASLKGA